MERSVNEYFFTQYFLSLPLLRTQHVKLDHSTKIQSLCKNKSALVQDDLPTVTSMQIVRTCGELMFLHISVVIFYTLSFFPSNFKVVFFF